MPYGKTRPGETTAPAQAEEKKQEQQGLEEGQEEEKALDH